MLLIVGIIPARAGFTPPLPGWRLESWDHPRSRGVYLTEFNNSKSIGGSSPLARGLRQVGGDRPARLRIIPARAGFTHSRSPIGNRTKDHPRSRGVYTSISYMVSPFGGSSPLARGLRLREVHSPAGLRIIPARAGFTSAFPASRDWGADHPRSRGVYRRRMSAWCASRGSSPLARGLLPVMEDGAVRLGIIPARAGFTSRDGGWCCASWDHPRSRGVYSAPDRAARSAEGSSPLARGLRPRRLRSCHRRWIIPARAGFTKLQRGEDGTITGSSPLARGLRAEAAVGPYEAMDHPRSRGVYSGGDR